MTQDWYIIGTVLNSQHSLGPHYFIEGPAGIVATFPFTHEGFEDAYQDLVQYRRGRKPSAVKRSIRRLLRKILPLAVLGLSACSSAPTIPVSTTGISEAPECPAQCPAGPEGPAGLDGAAGLDGQDGVDGAVGPTGPQGPEGPQGPQGVPGEQGLPGATGAQGSAGERGPVGATGPAGADGQDGVDAPPAATSGSRLTVVHDVLVGADGSMYRAPPRFHDVQQGWDCVPMTLHTGAQACVPELYVRPYGLSRFLNSSCVGAQSNGYYYVDHGVGSEVVNYGVVVADSLIRTVSFVRLRLAPTLYMMSSMGCIQDTAHTFVMPDFSAEDLLVEFTVQ
jgi:hypothetical protein